MSIGFLKAGSRGCAPGGVSGVSPDFLPPLAPEGGVSKNLYLKAPEGYLSQKGLFNPLCLW